MKNKGSLYVIVGPSGAGKGCVISKLLSKTENIFLSVSATTRNPRRGEEHGKHYLFVTQEEFAKMIEDEMLLEYATYVDNFYGTPKQPVVDALNSGKDVLLEIEVQGANNIKSAMPEANLLFITPPSFQELERRLRGRGTEDETKVERRLARAKEEYLLAKSFDYVIINENIDAAVDEIVTIMRANKFKTQNRLDFLEV